MSGIAVNVSRRETVLNIGRERLPVLCIDDFVADPHGLAARALNADFIDAGPVYPGVRAPAPPGYAAVLLDAVTAAVRSAFGVPPRREMELCAFSMVTRAPATLRPIQRIPHFDGPEPARLAFLHYLCEPRQGGTSFFRHIESGLEAVTPETVETYRALITRDLGMRSVQPGYAHAGMAGFERIYRVPAAFNRLLIYKANALHSGDIGEGTVLSEDASRGRLTVNGFGYLDG
jgi:hypothetical protein